MSLGGRGRTTALERSVDDAWGAGVVLVSISHNDGRDDLTYYPGAYRNVIGVAATTSNDQRASFSNAGNWVDVAAPGVNIYSTTPYTSKPCWFCGYPGNYGYWSGTSMAAPHVSGLAGLLFSRGYNNSKVRNLKESTAVDLGTSGRDPVFGFGRINAYAAVIHDYLDVPPPPEGSYYP